MRWEELLPAIDDLTERTAAVAWAVKEAVADIITTNDTGYYFSPELTQVAMYSPGIDRRELALCKSAAARAVGVDHVRPTVLDHKEIVSGNWIKVAYSPTLYRHGDAYSFFKLASGLPLRPSPLAAMLATGLVGGGLGYGLGWLGEKFLPNGYGKKLKRTGAVLGAMAGATPGAIWAGGNLANNKGITDSWPFDTDSGGNRSDEAPSTDVLNLPSKPQQPLDWLPDFDWPYKNLPAPKRLGKIAIGSMLKHAIEHTIKAGDFGDFGGGFAQREESTPYDVNINHLGQTLWQTGASQPLLGATMGVVYAAQQLPDPNAQPGVATGNQLGQLAVNVGKDYLTGRSLGALMNLAIGTPYSAPVFGLGNAALGLVRAGVKSLFS